MKISLSQQSKSKAFVKSKLTILPDIEHGVVARLQVRDHEEILVSAANEALNFLCL